jgi:hypothetical protein
MKENTIPLSARATSMTTASATLRLRRAFGYSHYLAAKHFAQLLKDREARFVGEGWGPHVDACIWYGSAAIILGFSAIEAAIDEARDDLRQKGLETPTYQRKPTLDLVQELIEHVKGRPFDKGATPCQDVQLLCDIRNALTHPKAEWDDERKTGLPLSRRIVQRRLPLSPFELDPDLAFPHGCMSAGVADWAADLARSFVVDFRTRLGLRLQPWG